MTSKEKEFIRLGWILMAAKFNYYVLDEPTFSDAEYDQLERRYDQLAKDLSLHPTAADMVGFNEDRPSARLVREKHMSSIKPTHCRCGQCEWSLR